LSRHGANDDPHVQEHLPVEVGDLLPGPIDSETARDRGAPECRIVGPEGESRPIPESVFFALERAAELLGRGDAITVVPIGKELTTQQAADILNVSRQYLVRLPDERRNPCVKTGKHRRVLVADLLAFKRERDRSRRGALNKLTQLSADHGEAGRPAVRRDDRGLSREVPGSSPGSSATK